MSSDWRPEKICVLGGCATFDFTYDAPTLASLRAKGFDAIVCGYLDANWDGEFSRIDMYSESSVMPGVIPHDRVERNRAELRRRLDLARMVGLKLYLSVRGPMTETDLIRENPEAAKRYHSCFGTGGDHWGGSGLRPLCLSDETVQAHYSAMFADVEARFPDIAGFMFFGGDSYCLVCDGTCPRCAGRPAYMRWGQWIDGLRREARGRGCAMRFDIMNWPWWDDMFDMANCVDPDVGFVAVTNWGFAYGGRSDDRYPAAVEPWECGEYQSDCLRVPVTDHGTALGLTQGWFNAPISDKFKALAGICRAQGRRIVGWAELICSEAVWPYLMPSPATTVDRLTGLRELGVDGVFDLWGIVADIASDRRVDANATAFKTFFDAPDAGADEVLRLTAVKLYGEAGAEWAVKAWREVDGALARWPIISYTQRMHWTLRRMFVKATCSFYVLDLTLNRESDPNLHFIPQWPEFLLHAEVWDRLGGYMAQVIAGYDRALGCYDRLREAIGTSGAGYELAAFHQDCLLLGRTYHQLCAETCVYQASGIRKVPLTEEFMREAVITRRLCRLLYTKLGVVPVESSIDGVLADMSGYKK